VQRIVIVNCKLLAEGLRQSKCATRSVGDPWRPSKAHLLCTMWNPSGVFKSECYCVIVYCRKKEWIGFRFGSSGWFRGFRIGLIGLNWSVVLVACMATHKPS